MCRTLRMATATRWTLSQRLVWDWAPQQRRPKRKHMPSVARKGHHRWTGIRNMRSLAISEHIHINIFYPLPNPDFPRCATFNSPAVVTDCWMVKAVIFVKKNKIKKKNQEKIFLKRIVGSGRGEKLQSIFFYLFFDWKGGKTSWFRTVMNKGPARTRRREEKKQESSYFVVLFFVLLSLHMLWPLLQD